MKSQDKGWGKRANEQLTCNRQAEIGTRDRKT